MTIPACQRERGRLAEALKAVRVGASLSGARLAEMLGWQQSKVPKIEVRQLVARLASPRPPTYNFLYL
jgi:hypothetical protein